MDLVLCEVQLCLLESKVWRIHPLLLFMLLNVGKIPAPEGYRRGSKGQYYKTNNFTYPLLARLDSV